MLEHSRPHFGDLVIELQASMPDRQACLCRELTKMHEEIIRDSILNLPITQQRGEIVLVIGEGSAVISKPKPLNSLKDISAALGELWGISKREAYNFLVKNKPE